MTFPFRLGGRAWRLGVGAMIAGAASGLCAAGLIALVNRALNRPDSWGATLAWGFAGLVVARAVGAACGQILVAHLSQRVLEGLYLDVSRRLLAVPLARLEAIGLPRILAALTDDVTVITWGIQVLPGLAINLAILSGCGIYLGWLAWQVFVVVLGFVLLGTASFMLLLRPARRQWRRLAEQRDRLMGHVRALVDGTKELKLNAARREAFLTQSMTSALEGIRHASLAAAIRQSAATAWSQGIFFLLVGLLLFGLPSLRDGSHERLTGYLLVVIYMMNPLASVIETWPYLARGRVAAERLRDLTARLERDAGPRSTTVQATNWERLELKNVRFAYRGDDGRARFELGPLDFALRPGEIVFVTGGNGSGKSTFAKVLTGLYVPEAGEIRLDGRPVTDDTRPAYHGLFSAVFSDFHLFDRLLGVAGSDVDARARSMLRRLELFPQVDVQDGVFSTTTLSSGQRKRVALVTALLDDRPIYVLDEWAADQDPQAREMFYTGLLPELRRRGKAVVVISHDDRYYGHGDRVVRLAYGEVVP